MLRGRKEKDSNWDDLVRTWGKLPTILDIEKKKSVISSEASVKVLARDFRKLTRGQIEPLQSHPLPGPGGQLSKS